MKTIKTIGRNQRKRAEAIFNNAKDLKSYTLNNGFTGKECKLLNFQGENWMLKDWNRFSFAKLTQNGNNKFTLHITDNEWIDFTI